MTLSELQKRPDFVTLSTANQKDFVVAFCSNGADRLAAAHTAHKCKNDKIAASIANRHLRHPSIKKLVEDFYDKPIDTGDKEQALAMIWKKLQGTLADKDFVSLMNLYSKIKGFEPPSQAAPEPPAPEIEDLTEVENILRG